MWRRARGVAPVTMIYNGVVCKPTGPADMRLHPQLQRVRSWDHDITSVAMATPRVFDFTLPIITIQMLRGWILS